MAAKELNVGDVLPPVQLLEKEHFYKRDSLTLCVRPSCEGCQYDPRCQREEMFTRIGPGINIREAFRSRPGYRWVSIDFKGIELRVATQQSGEPTWMKAWLTGGDPHQEIAKIMFKKDEPTKAERDIGKMGNFGNLYLASIETFHALTTLTYNEAAVAWKKWWAAVPVYKQYTERQIAFYRKNLYVKTYFGRRREMAELIQKAQESEKSGKRGKKIGMGFCDRTSVNTDIQGTSADILKMAMVRVDRWVEKEKLRNDVKMFLTVHDELDFEIREQPNFYEICREIGRQMTMTPKGAKLPEIKNWRVPLEVDIEIGDNWGNMTHIKDLDPEGEDNSAEKKQTSVLNDSVVLQIASLREEDAPKLHMAIFKAANVEGVVKVPLKFQMGDRVYQSGTLGKVSESFLRKELEGIPGIRFN